MAKKRVRVPKRIPLNQTVGTYQGKKRKVSPGPFWMLAGIAGWAFDLLVIRTADGAGFLFQFLIGFFAAAILYGFLSFAAERGVKGAKACRILRRCMEAGFAVWVVSFIIIQFVIASGKHTELPEQPPDFLIIMGAGVRGTTPSAVFQSRLDTALVYLKANPGVKAVCTGGQGSGEDITEAEAARRFLSAGGIGAERILMEDGASSSTRDNLRFSRELVPEGAVTAVCSNEFHLYRSRWISRKQGFDAYGLAAETPGWNYKAMYYFREYFSVVLMFLGRY